VIAPGTRRIVLATAPVDFRRGMDSLAALVQQALATSPFCGDIFIFRSKRADRIKILVWDGTGLWLHQKRLEKGRFVWPPIRDGVITLGAVHLNMLLEGLDWSRIVPVKTKSPELAC